MIHTNIGKIIKIADEIVEISGLPKAGLGNVLITEKNTKLLITAIYPTHIIAASFLTAVESRDKMGDFVYLYSEALIINVLSIYRNNIINPLGEIVMNLSEKSNQVSSSRNTADVFTIPAPIVSRMPVCESLQTGIKATDIIIPIGKGQRELVIGDRKTGKSSIVLDTIINQRYNNQFNNKGYLLNYVMCVYIGIGQRASTIKNLAIRLKKKHSLYYSIVISAPASSATLLQYIAPYVGTAIGEYYRDSGLHCLVVYDDLLKHAQAYRQIALLSGFAPGREAYPGDVFYIHANLLERSAKLNKLYNCGSLTSLPIVETYNNNLTGYIPTNIISITDGQIYLDSLTFNSGIKPAIHLQASVSRVGSKAQSKILTELSKLIKLSIQAYYNLDVLYKTGELNQFAKLQYLKGRACYNLFRQFHSMPLTLQEQILCIYIAIYGYADIIEEKEIVSFYRYFVENFNQYLLINRLILNSKNLVNIKNIYNYLHKVIYSLMVI